MTNDVGVPHMFLNYKGNKVKKMDMDNIGSEELRELAYKYGRGKATPDEFARLMEWYHHLQKEEAVLPEGDEQQLKNSILDNTWQIIKADELRALKVRRLRKWSVSVAAAAILACFATFVVYNTRSHHPEQLRLTKILDVAPGKNDAVLVTAEGKSIHLSESNNGTIASVNGSAMVKTDSGSLKVAAQGLVAENGNNPASLVPISRYNALKTPSGGQFRLVLPDGTEVFLNAATVLSFPEKFTGKERRVILTGEAFFKVAHNRNMPFKVITKKQEIEVLGTEFNVNSYDDEPDAVTTLKNGSVRIVADENGKTIVPGQKAITSTKGSLNIQQADMATELSWINGKIRFKNAPLTAILRQIARWYNVSIVYQGKQPALKLTGGISRQSNLSEDLLPVLRMNNIEYNLESEGKSKNKILTIINK